MQYCVFKTIEWVNYVILTALLVFLLTLHCLMYKKVNGSCSWLILKRNRVQIICLSLLLTGSLVVKLTFMMDYADLLLLVIA